MTNYTHLYSCTANIEIEKIHKRRTYNVLYLTFYGEKLRLKKSLVHDCTLYATLDAILLLGQYYPTLHVFPCIDLYPPEPIQEPIRHTLNTHPLTTNPIEI